MNMIVTALALGLALGSGHAPQMASPAAQPCAQAFGQAPSVQQLPIMPVDTSRRAVQITQGPVVEQVTDTTAEIAWSTNVNSGTALRYGTDPSHMDQTAGMPWGGLTHRVTIKNLQPNTTYYFKAESGQGQGTGTQAETAQASFQTKPAGATSQVK
jgi:Purple acid Phosphatase, N-terminal domain